MPCVSMCLTDTPAEMAERDAMGSQPLNQVLNRCLPPSEANRLHHR